MNTKVLKPSATRFEYGLNTYIGCGHGCLYCYGMKMMFKRYEDWIQPKPRHQVIDWLKKDIEKIKKESGLSNIQDIMVCSVTDCYQPLEMEHRLTKGVIEVLRENDLPFTVLTKNHNVIEDIDLFKGYEKCRVGLTIVTLDDGFRQQIEPGASSIEERIEALKQLHQAGISTYCSVEPILPDKGSDPIEIADVLGNDVDLFEFGKWNPKNNSKTIVEETLGTKYSEEYYIDVFKRISNLKVNYCHAGHSEEFLNKYGMEFKPYPLVSKKVCDLLV